jgi:hypothetical protein
MRERLDETPKEPYFLHQAEVRAAIKTGDTILPPDALDRG